MRTHEDLLVQYAAYHRDRRNVATHCVGVPLIVFAVGVLLARPGFDLAGLPLSPAWCAWTLATLWWLSRGDVALGLATSASAGLLVWLGQPASVLGTGAWLAVGIGSFALGWLIQFVGHAWEGRKPAFVDDLVGLLVGPMFVTAEALFALGWNARLHEAIRQRDAQARTLEATHRA